MSLPAPPPPAPPPPPPFPFTDFPVPPPTWPVVPAAPDPRRPRLLGLLTAAITGGGGQVFNTLDERVNAVFPTAHQALAAAVAAARALEQEPPDPVLGRLRVSMALHSGLAEARDGDYFGRPLNR